VWVLVSCAVVLERRIAEALQRQDFEVALTEAIRGYGPQILGYVRSICRGSEDAGDVFAQFAEELWRALPTFRRNTTLRAFAYRLAWTAAARFYSDAYRRHRERLPTSMASRLAASIQLEHMAAVEREAADLAKLRAELAPEEQTLLVLRLDRDLSWAEIADVLAEDGRAVDQAALRKRFERLKAKIAQKAKDQGLLDG
jgi:RNA polymerase sigma-70 factor (ECF subfamily)